jgi:hypothetical protein
MDPGREAWEGWKPFWVGQGQGQGQQQCVVGATGWQPEQDGHCSFPHSVSEYECIHSFTQAWIKCAEL